METTSFNGFEFKVIYKCPFSSVYYNETLKMALCIAEVEYIPIDNFKAIFYSISDFIEKSTIQHLVFDKRNLRTFHQPSMEWYFAIWKPIVKLKGLVNHYKILPEPEWFVQAVMAGKHEIFKKYDKDLLNGINVYYVDSIESAIENLNAK